MKGLDGSVAGLAAAATLAAFGGSFAGARLIKEVPLRGVQILVGAMLASIAAALAAGFV